jgi:hypothetical protein
MKVASIVGILLVIVGVIGLAYGGITYTHREKVIDVGPIQATAEKHDRIPLPPIVGGLSLAAGIVLLVAGAKRA